jgi:heme-degrading monooxygenase HmoA
VFARVIVAQGAIEGLAGAVGAAQEHLPAAAEQPGFRGFYLLIDRETGKLMTVSLWETREQAEAAEARAGRARADVAPAVGISREPVVEIYEVAVGR